MMKQYKFDVYKNKEKASQGILVHAESLVEARKIAENSLQEAIKSRHFDNGSKINFNKSYICPEKEKCPFCKEPETELSWAEFQDLTASWFEYTGIAKHGTLEGQIYKMGEEFGEVGQALAKNDKDLLRDAIGDTCVTIISVLKQANKLTGEDLSISYESCPGGVDLFVITEDGALIINYYLGAFGQIAKLFENISILIEGKETHKFHELQLSNFNTRMSAREVVVLLHLIGALSGLTLGECLAKAWSEIRDRDGFMNEQGVFIKNE